METVIVFLLDAIKTCFSGFCGLMLIVFVWVLLCYWWNCVFPKKEAPVVVPPVPETVLDKPRFSRYGGIYLGRDCNAYLDSDGPLDEYLSVRADNRLNKLPVKQGFVDMYLNDETLIQYDPVLVFDAYNKVLQMEPEIHLRRNSGPIITAMVKRVLFM